MTCSRMASSSAVSSRYRLRRRRVRGCGRAATIVVHTTRPTATSRRVRTRWRRSPRVRGGEGAELFLRLIVLGSRSHTPSGPILSRIETLYFRGVGVWRDDPRNPRRFEAGSRQMPPSVRSWRSESKQWRLQTSSLLLAPRPGSGFFLRSTTAGYPHLGVYRSEEHTSELQ